MITTFFWITIVVILLTLIIASVYDVRIRQVPKTLWHPVYFLSIIAIIFYISTGGAFFWPSVALCVIYYLLNHFDLLGGADAWCMMLITLLLPVTPISEFYFPGLFACVVGLLVLAAFPILHMIKEKEYKVPFMVIVLVGFILSLGIEWVIL